MIKDLYNIQTRHSIKLCPSTFFMIGQRLCIVIDARCQNWETLVSSSIWNNLASFFRRSPSTCWSACCGGGSAAWGQRPTCRCCTSPSTNYLHTIYTLYTQVLHLSISALLMNSPIILFLVNLYHQGPYLGEMGAKVRTFTIHFSTHLKCTCVQSG